MTDTSPDTRPIIEDPRTLADTAGSDAWHTLQRATDPTIISGVSVHPDDTEWIADEVLDEIARLVTAHGEQIGRPVLIGDLIGEDYGWDDDDDEYERAYSEFWAGFDIDLDSIISAVARRVPVGMSEISERSGVPVETIRTWRKVGKFPQPRELAAGPVWWWHDVAVWLEQPRRGPGRPPVDA